MWNNPQHNWIVPTTCHHCWYRMQPISVFHFCGYCYDLANHEPCIRLLAIPNFYKQDFTDENFMAEHLNKENLKMVFNYFDGYFLFEGIQQRFEVLASRYCRRGTEIVSLGHMYFDSCVLWIWNSRIVVFTTGKFDLLWTCNVGQLDIYVYTKLYW